MHACMHACMHAYIHAYMIHSTYFNTYVHTYRHAYIHAYIHTYTHTGYTAHIPDTSFLVQTLNLELFDRIELFDQVESFDQIIEHHHSYTYDTQNIYAYIHAYIHTYTHTGYTEHIPDTSFLVQTLNLELFDQTVEACPDLEAICMYAYM